MDFVLANIPSCRYVWVCKWSLFNDIHKCACSEWNEGENIKLMIPDEILFHLIFYPLSLAATEGTYCGL